MTDRELLRKEAIEEREAIMIHDGEIPEDRAHWLALGCVSREFDERSKEYSGNPFVDGKWGKLGAKKRSGKESLHQTPNNGSF